MSTNYLALRNSNLSTFSAVNFTARTATYSTITLASSIVSLGQSTNQTYYGQTNGVYTTGWGSTLNTLTSNVKQVAMGSLGQYQVAVCGASTANSVYVTQNSGQTWSTLSAATGLPTAATTLYTSGAVSATGQYGILGTNTGLLSTTNSNGGGNVYVTNNSGLSYSGVLAAVPAIYLPFDTVPANGSLSQGLTPATLTVVGPPTSVAGVIGTNAIRLANTAGGNATQYIRGTWTPGSNYTVSFWFNVQSLNGQQQNIYSSHGGPNTLYINTSNYLAFYGGSINLAITSFTIAINTWYNVTLIFQSNGIGYFYVNNVLIGSATCASSPGTSSGYFTIGALDGSGFASAFNGYIDDFRLYNYVLPFPINYNYTAVSGNGQYMLASVSNGGLFMSSNFGSTWSQVQSVANQGVWTGLCLSYTGQYMLTNGGGGYVVPQLTGLPSSGTALTTSPWTANGVTWIGSASTVLSTIYPISYAFDNVYNPGSSSLWASNSIYNGSYLGNVSTTVQGGIGSVLGEWLQIQSSIPLVMYSYVVGVAQHVTNINSYIIVGSNDNTTWYPLHAATLATNPANTSNPTSTYLLVNYTGTQQITVNTTQNVVTTSYPTSTNAYTYFRIICRSVFAGGNYFETIEWFINFVGGQSYSTNYGNSWVNTTFATGNALAISDNGQYAIGANVQTAYIVNNYLAGFSTQSFTSPTLTSINATIVAAAISNTGQCMVLVTAGTSNNLYYSMNYGATFTGLTLGSIALVSCSMSYDGSYITAASATTVYTLNSNGKGFSLAVGANAGAANQAQNAIALGNSAGQTNQTANSIILNASGSALNSYSQGFYVAPIATALSCTSQTVALLGYGTDNQVVQSGITMANSQQVIYGEWIQLQLATGASITSYVLQVRPGGATARYPASWTIVGSLDGVNWTVLDSQTGSTSTLWGTSYMLKSASPIYTYFRIIISQINTASNIVDFGGFILYNNGNSIIGPYANYSVIQSGLYNTLQYNSITVCTVTFSWLTSGMSIFGIISDGTINASQNPGWIATSNGYTMGGPYFIGFNAFLVGPAYEYNSSGIATQGTSTIITNPLLQVADLSGNIKFQSSTQYPLDVNGVLRTQQLQFQDGSIQRTASNMQLNWGQFGQNWAQNSSAPSGNWSSIVCSYTGQYQLMYGTSYAFVSSNYGQTWTSTGVGAGPLAMSSSGQYQAISYLTNVYISSTYGQTFTTIAVPFSSALISASIAMSGSGQYMTASYGKLIYTSSNYGQTWTYITSLSTIGSNIAMSSSGQYQTVAGDAGNAGYIYTSSNYGQTWTQYSALNLQFWYLSMSSSGQYQLVANFNSANPSTTVYTSSNYGVSWNPVTIPNAFIAATAMSGSGQYQIVAGNSGTLYVSTNYGTTFSTTNYGNGSSYYHAVAISGSGQYATVVAYGGLVYTSIVPSYMLGNVGIGASAPINLLTLQGTGSQTCTIAFNDSVNPVPYVGIGYDQTYDSLSFYTNTAFNYLSVTSMVIKRVTGYVGIGTTAPGTTLDVNGDLRAINVINTNAAYFFGIGVTNFFTYNGNNNYKYLKYSFSVNVPGGFVWNPYGAAYRMSFNGVYNISLTLAGLGATVEAFISKNNNGDTLNNSNTCLACGYGSSQITISTTVYLSTGDDIYVGYYTGDGTQYYNNNRNKLAIALIARTS